jgi:aconitate hydratase
VLSGNRNFEARIHPLVRANYIASPMLVVAYALAGRVDMDLAHDPLGTGRDGKPVYLKDVWPSAKEIADSLQTSLSPEQSRKRYAHVFEGTEAWRALPAPEGARYAWDAASTYIADPPFFQGIGPKPGAVTDIRGARALALLGDSVTTDHISPAGSIAKDGPAGRWLQDHGVKVADFNTYGARRGHHDVMMRGTFANVRIRNLMTDREGGWTIHLPTGETIPIFDAAMRYHAEGTPLIVIAGKEYGTGSSRDWAAKGTMLLGVRAVIAESYERIHRSNLVGMGVLPLQFLPDQNAKLLGLTGRETFDIEGLSAGLAPGAVFTVRVRDGQGPAEFRALARIDSPIEVDYYRNGGILTAVLRQMARG